MALKYPKVHFHYIDIEDIEGQLGYMHGTSSGMSQMLGMTIMCLHYQHLSSLKEVKK